MLVSVVINRKYTCSICLLVWWNRWSCRWSYWRIYIYFSTTNLSSSCKVGYEL